MPLTLPAALEEEWRSEPEWLARLPELVAECAELWGLEIEDELFETPRSLVVPAGDVVLKLNAPSHDEADHEGAALAVWDGRGAVRLLAEDTGRRALLVERCRPGTRLVYADVDAAAVVCELLPWLSVEPARGHLFRPIADEAGRWAGEIAERYERAGRPFERPLVALALDVLGSADRSAHILVNQDLHGGNVLRAEREPWLVIDPKPAVGEPEVSGAGLLREAAWMGGTAEVRRWLSALSGTGLDRARLREWGVAHTLAWGWSDERGWEPDALAAARAIFAA